jgi:hypothetical protein
MKNLTNQQASDLLKAWIALEVLSPQIVHKITALAYRNNSSIIKFDDAPLPWENEGEKTPTETKLSYQVILGTIDFKKAIDLLLARYSNNNAAIEEDYSATGRAIIGVLELDSKGCPFSLNLSSFAWGINETLTGNITDLYQWSNIEKNLLKNFIEEICEKDKNNNYIPLSRAKIEEAAEYLIDLFKIPRELIADKPFAIKICSKKDHNPPQPPLLNSFYLKDLELANSLVTTSSATENLKKYLGIETPKNPHNILDNDSLMENILAPQNIPSSRWPSVGRNPLVLLQQAAVNLSQSELKDDGILAVNGPPGTGKTTLLRDVIASVVTKRAEAMLKFADPATAFSKTGHQIPTGNGWLDLYGIDESLKGFEILIASSNNKAVENITAELPSLKAIASDAEELRYFSCLASKITGVKSWGIISAVLGNSGNRSRFRQNFWWDKDFGLATYLAEAIGNPQTIDIDPETHEIIEPRPPKIIAENNPPRSSTEALQRWKEAQKSFVKALNNYQKQQTELENLRKDIHEFEVLVSSLDLSNNSLQELLAEHQKTKPHFIAHILRFSSATKWKKLRDKLHISVELEKKLLLISQKIRPHIINKEFFLKNHSDKNQTSPWYNSTTQELRDEVFIESIKLIKAFIDAAARPLLNNLGILMKFFNNPNNLFEESKNKEFDKDIALFLPSLWSSFFLVVPSVSSTFASVGSMMKYLPPNYLGWLIIDEAGQAVPQAAVGAILKTKRAVITGDPLQIEPVVTLPKILTEKIFNEFKADSNRFNAPKASVQTLADSASNYYAEFCTIHGNRSVGFPLLVHRRCAEPMFSISNVIAYERLMVQAKPKKPSLIQTCLGKSIWFDVKGESSDKWCKEEGEKVIEILNKLKTHLITPDLYIITPFKNSATNLCDAIRDSNVMDGWQDSTWINEHVGTVHTVQGREADSVILVLGAQAEKENGARLWAGLTPNILNVAVTRAKENLYVVGNKELWKEVGVFKELHDRISHG